ncbi:hypothetical protein ACWEKT_21170 [Nocardia takedensis]
MNAAPTTPDRRTDRRRAVLWLGAVAYLAGYLIHSIRHIVHLIPQTPTPTLVLGSAGWLLAVVVVLAVRRDHPHAPHVLIAIGLFTGAMVLLVHLAPDWTPFNQPWRQHNATFTMWFSLGANAVGALIAAVAGAVALRMRPAR